MADRLAPRERCVPAYAFDHLAPGQEIDGPAIVESAMTTVLLRPGDRVRWKGVDQFALTLGNAGGVRVALNGKEQGPFGPRGKVARDIVLKR